jgi:uncharacterized protein (UPF0548 family)
MAVVENVLVDADMVKKEVARVKATGADTEDMSWDMQMGLGLSSHERRKASVDFHDDRSMVIHLLDDLGDKMQSVTIKENRITRIENEDRQRDFEYTKGGQVHMHSREGDEPKLLTRDIIDPSMGTLGAYLEVARVAIKNAPASVKEQFSEEALAAAIHESNEKRKSTPRPARGCAVKARVLDTKGFKSRAQGRKEAFNDSISAATHPLTLTFDGELGNCLAGMPMTEGSVKIAHNVGRQDLAVAFTNPVAVEAYLTRAKDYLNREVDASFDSVGTEIPERVHFVPKEARLVETSQKIHGAVASRG